MRNRATARCTGGKVFPFPLLLLPILLSPHALFGEDQVKEREMRLERVRSEIEKKTSELRDKEKREESILRELEGLDRDLDSLQVSLLNLTRNERSLKSEMTRIEGEISRVDERIDAGKDLLAQRLAYLYRVSRRGIFNIVLNSPEAGKLLRRVRYLLILLKKDLSLIKEFKTMADLKALLNHRKEEDMKRLRGLRADILAKREEIEREKAIKNGLIREIRKEKTLYKKVLAELLESSRSLSMTLSKLPGPPAVTERAHPRDVTFQSLKGRHLFPVDGRVTELFGRYQAPEMMAPIFRKGIDIEAPAGTEFFAIFDGEVKVARWFRGYGLLIILDHGEGYFSVYAHASRIVVKAGDRVGTGDLLGFVGDTGSLKGPYLYFEIRHREAPLDPLEWVRIPPEALSDTN